MLVTMYVLLNPRGRPKAIVSGKQSKDLWPTNIVRYLKLVAFGRTESDVYKDFRIYVTKEELPWIKMNEKTQICDVERVKHGCQGR